MDKEKISVIVPFYNAETTLPLCLNALANQYLKPIQVILVDNNSTDKSAEIVKEFIRKCPENFLYLSEHRQGPSYARNCGYRIAKGDILAFTDADCIPAPNWLTEVKDGFSDNKIGAVAGRIISFSTESLIDKFHSMFTLKGLPSSEVFSNFNLVRGGFPTANLSVRRGVFEIIKGFDELMKIYTEDYDLCARIYNAGFSIKYTIDAIVYHKHRNTLKGTWRQSFGFGKGHAVLLKKHFKHLVIIDIPKYQYLSTKLPFRLWLDLAGIDKKIIIFVFLSFMWLPLSTIVVCYLLFLYKYIISRLRQNGLTTGFFEKWQLMLLLVFKSIAITSGRIIGSVKNKVFCF